jgi:hypothetical protein
MAVGNGQNAAEVEGGEMSEKDVWIHTVADPEVSLRLYESIRDRGDVKRALVVVEHVDGDRFSVLGQHLTATEMSDLLEVANVAFSERQPDDTRFTVCDDPVDMEEEFNQFMQKLPAIPPPTVRWMLKALFVHGAMTALGRLQELKREDGEPVARWSDLDAVAFEFMELADLDWESVANS